MKYLDHSLPVEERVEDLLSLLTLEEKIGLLTETAGPIERLGIDKYHHGNEALHGVVRPGQFTVFPQAIALAATWNPDLLYEITSAISDESRAKHEATKGQTVTDHGGRASGLLTFWSPNLNLARDPRWGRTGETYGEDPHLAGRLGVAFVRGLQGDHPQYLKAVSTPKHYTANNEEHNRFECNANMSEKALREYFLPPFRDAVVEGGCASVMAAYNAINGVPCHASKKLLKDILRDEWGFDGYIVTDCGAVSHLLDRHKYVESPEHAAAAAIEAGIDLECGTYGTIPHVFQKCLAKAHEMGLVSTDTIDRAARNVLTGRFRLGIFDPDEMVPWTKLPAETVGCQKHVDLALKAACESMVLLKNDSLDGKPILPMQKKGTIAVVGNNAAVCQFGDYSGKPANPPVSPLEGIIQKAGSDVEIRHVPWTFRKPETKYTAIPREHLCVVEDGVTLSGLRGEYYKNQNLQGEPSVRIDSSIDFDWENMPPDPIITTERFSVRWTGQILATITGDYRIRLTAKGPTPCEPALLFLDGEQVNPETTVRLEAGQSCRVRVDFSRALENPLVRLEWIEPVNLASHVFADEVRVAAECDAVIAVVGLGTDYEREGRDKTSLDLPIEQMDMIRRVAEVNKNVVVVLINGSPLSISWIHENVPAILEGWYPGEQGGRALADVLFGDYNPGGRLPLTFYRSTASLPAFDDYEISNGRTYMYLNEKPLYCFGHGLSYTSFHYGAVELSTSSVGEADTITVSLDVRNIGAATGDEVVQVYVRNTDASEQRPKQQLKAFTRVTLLSGELRRVELEVKVSDLALWDDGESSFRIEPGEYEILVGASSEDIRQRARFSIGM